MSTGVSQVGPAAEETSREGDGREDWSLEQAWFEYLGNMPLSFSFRELVSLTASVSAYFGPRVTRCLALLLLLCF